MLSETRKLQITLGLALALLMAVTRGHHFAAIDALPAASWAVFFLAGLYFRPAWAFVAFIAEAALLDFAGMTWDGVVNLCGSPAYGFLLPAYGALWLSGRWLASRTELNSHNLVPLVASVLVGTAACEILSSGGFYYFSGRFAEPTLAEFGSRLVTYFPGDLQSTAFYVAIAAALHLTWKRFNDAHRPAKQ